MQMVDLSRKKRNVFSGLSAAAALDKTAPWGYTGDSALAANTCSTEEPYHGYSGG